MKRHEIAETENDTAASTGTMRKPTGHMGTPATSPYLNHATKSSFNAHSSLGWSLLQKLRRREFFASRGPNETLREWIQRSLEESLAGYLFDGMMAVLGTFMVIFYVAVNWNELVVDNASWVTSVDFKINLLFTVEYLFRLYAAYDRWEFAKRFFHMTELIVLLPSWFDFFVSKAGYKTSGFSFVQAFRGLRPLRILRSYRFLDFTSSTLQRHLLSAALLVVSIAISTAGVLQVIEYCNHECHGLPRVCKCQSLSFLDFLYFVVVSISTLGYGDIAPVSFVGKLLISFIILLTFVLVPIHINRISAVIASHTDYSSSYTEAKQHPHIILTGHIDTQTLLVFFHEFFHPSNLNWNEKVVILNAQPPTSAIHKVLNAFEGKVKYLVGSPLLDEDLERAVLASARACFVLVNRNAYRRQYADQCSALITIALRRGHPTCPIYVQVLGAHNVSTILKMGATDVVVDGLMKGSILGRSCEVAGLSSLFGLLTFHSPHEVENSYSVMQWQRPYMHGFMHEIFLIDIPRTFSGFTFGDLVNFLYDKTCVLPLAMLTEEGVKFIDLEFKLGATADPTLCCRVFALAKGLDAVEAVAQISPEHVLSYRKNMRRKVKLTPDAVVDSKAIAAKIKPAMGGDLEVDQIRTALIELYTQMDKYEGDDDNDIDYDSFVKSGAPSNLSKHIVVCGFPRDTFQFLKAVREAPVLDPEMGSPSVVFLAPEPISEEHYDYLRCFHRVYFISGSPVNFADLKKTQLESAIAVLVLTPTTQSVFADMNMIDADAITTVRYIVEMSHGARSPTLVVELNRPSNVKLLGSFATERRASASLVFAKAVTRQLSYRTNQRRSSISSRETQLPDEGGGDVVAASAHHVALEEFFAAGSVYLDLSLDALLSECYRKPWISQFLHVIVNGRVDDPLHRRIYQIEVPTMLVSLRYDECFRKILDKTNAIMIGLFRPERGFILPHSCVFVNPPPDTQVESGDLLYLVGAPLSTTYLRELFSPKS